MAKYDIEKKLFKLEKCLYPFMEPARIIKEKATSQPLSFYLSIPACVGLESYLVLLEENGCDCWQQGSQTHRPEVLRFLL